MFNTFEHSTVSFVTFLFAEQVYESLVLHY